MTQNQKSLVKGFKYRIYPTKEQKDYLQKVFGSARFVYNHLLAELKDEYENYKKDQSIQRTPINKISLTYRLPSLKQKEEYQWLNDTPAQVLQHASGQLAEAFLRFFKSKIGHPRFKSKHGRQSVTFSNQIYSIDGNRLKLLKCKSLFKVNLHRPLPSFGLKSCTISKTSSGKYYASFLCEYIPEKTSGTGFLGIDAGITDLATLSNGLILLNPKHYVKQQYRLAQLSRRLARKQKGSKNRNKARLKVARLHEHIANQRCDYMHKFTTSAIRENQAVAIENLQIRNMIKNRQLSKHIADAAWGEMRRQLAYKAIASQNCLLVIADPYYPSTQLCNKCNRKPSQKIKLGVTKWVCEYCGEKHQRDHNASLNLEVLARSYYYQQKRNGETASIILAKPYSPLI